MIFLEFTFTYIDWKLFSIEINFKIICETVPS